MGEKCQIPPFCTLHLRYEFTIVSILVLQQLALDSLRLRSRANDFFFHKLKNFVNKLMIFQYPRFHVSTFPR